MVDVCRFLPARTRTIRKGMAPRPRQKAVYGLLRRIALAGWKPQGSLGATQARRQYAAQPDLEGATRRAAERAREVARGYAGRDSAPWPVAGLRASGGRCLAQ